MIKHTTNHIINHLFAEVYNYDGKYPIDSSVVLCQYNIENIRFEKINPVKGGYKSHCREGFINWFDVKGLGNTSMVHDMVNELGFFPIDAKSVLTPCHAAKIDDYDGRLIIVLRPAFFDRKNNISSEHICILVKENVIVTFREQGVISFDHVVKALRVNMMHIRQSNKGMAIAFILNAILSVMIGTAIKVEEMLGNIDTLLLEENQNNSIIGRKIQRCSYANLYLQKTAVPLKDEFDKLLHIRLISESRELMPVYMELYNQLDYIVLTSRNARDLLASLRDLYVSNNDLKTNTIMKRLTIAATLFIPISFLVGLWGMNFETIPEFKWKYGYYFAWLVMITTALLTWLFMKRNKWF